MWVGGSIILFSFLLEFNKTRDEIAQARTHIQRHMNNACKEMVIVLTPCLALYCSFSTWYSQTIWDNSSLTADQPCRLITNLFLLVIHFYDYDQSNAPPSRILPFWGRSICCGLSEVLSIWFWSKVDRFGVPFMVLKVAFYFEQVVSIYNASKNCPHLSGSNINAHVKWLHIYI
jgi:hypothetical protein